MSRCRTVGGVVRAGTVVDDRYELIELLGAGGFGQVWRAQDLRIGRPVAVKVASPDSHEELARLHREATVAGSLAHPRIVTVHDYGTWIHPKGRTYAYLVMELLAGEPLSAVIPRRGAFDLYRTIIVTSHVTQALMAAHDAGLVHRDIKPSNIMLDDTDDLRIKVKVVDFGITKGADFHHDITAVNAVVGSPAYMAPECFDGDFSPQSDLYSLGCVIHEMVTGYPPFAGKRFGELARQHQHQPARRLHTLRPDVAPELDDLTARLLEKNPEDRPADAPQVHDVLWDIFERIRRERSRRRGLDANTQLLIRPADVGTVIPVRITVPVGCPRCTPQAPREDCPICEGSGEFKAVRTKKVRIPPGTRDGQLLRLPGFGRPGHNGGAPGDLYLEVGFRQSDPEQASQPDGEPAPAPDTPRTQATPAPPWKTTKSSDPPPAPPSGTDTAATITLNVADAATGRTLRLPITATCPGCAAAHGGAAASDCPDCEGSGMVHRAETKRIRIPPGVRDGQTLRLPGLGDTGSSGEAGDLYLTVRVQGLRDQPTQAPAAGPVIPDDLKARLLAQLAAGPMHIRDLRAAVPDVRGSAVTVALRDMEGRQVARVSHGVWRLA